MFYVTVLHLVYSRGGKELLIVCKNKRMIIRCDQTIGFIMKDFCGHFMWQNDFKLKLAWLTNNEQKIKPNIKPTDKQISVEFSLKADIP